jgi:hypothetical protein
MVPAIEVNIIYFVGIVCSFRSFPSLRSVSPGAFPESARDEPEGKEEGGSLYSRIAEVHVFVRFLVAEALGSYGVFAHCFGGGIAVTCDDVLL